MEWMGLNMLTMMIFWPLGMAVLLLLMPDRWVRWGALLGSLPPLVMAGMVLRSFDPAGGVQGVLDVMWLPLLGARYHVGVDGLSVALLALTNLLTPLCVLSAWEVKDRVGAFMACLHALAGVVNGVFVAQDFLLFYVFFEASLVPLYVLIGMWGGENRIYAALKFFLYTFLGSVLLLVAGIWLWSQSGTWDMAVWQGLHVPVMAQRWLLVAMMVAFAVKIPMWPVHTWLPDAHVQAPTAGSVMLAGILLKLGGYGMLRLVVPVLPDAVVWAAPVVFALSAVAVVYAALVAWAQTDIKKVIAYSSVSHMGLVTMGIFALNASGLHGAMLVMLNHGIVSAGLFLMIGVIYDRLHTRELVNLGGLAGFMPGYAFVVLVLTLAAVALPLTNGFVGEFLALLGGWQAAPWAAGVAVTGVIWGAVYMLALYRGMMYGVPSAFVEKHVKACADLHVREWVMFMPLLVLVVLFGLQPRLLQDTWAGYVQAVLVRYHPPVTFVAEGALPPPPDMQGEWVK